MGKDPYDEEGYAVLPVVAVQVGANPRLIISSSQPRPDQKRSAEERDEPEHAVEGEPWDKVARHLDLNEVGHAVAQHIGEDEEPAADGEEYHDHLVTGDLTVPYTPPRHKKEGRRDDGPDESAVKKYLRIEVHKWR